MKVKPGAMGSFITTACTFFFFETTSTQRTFTPSTKLFPIKLQIIFVELLLAIAFCKSAFFLFLVLLRLQLKTVFGLSLVYFWRYISFFFFCKLIFGDIFQTIWSTDKSVILWIDTVDIYK